MTTTALRWRARWRRSAVAAAAAALAAVAAVLSAAAPASAAGAPQRGGASAAAGGDGVDVEGSRGADGGGTGHAAAGGAAAEGGPRGPVRVVNYVLMCQGNTPAAPADVAMCPGAQANCAAPELHYWRFVSTGGGPFVQDGAMCLTPEQAAAGGGAAFPGFDVDDLRRLPLPPGVAVLEPGGGYALVGVPVNAVAGAAALVLPAAVAGFDVQVRATPASYTWDFGDGTSLTTTDPGAPYPALDVTHTYTAGGALQVTLTTAYSGEFSVDGGAFTPIAGTAVVASPPVPLALLTGRSGLVAQPRG